MSFDPRSRERLEALGRRLPQPLPAPQPQPSASSARHPVETEEDPERLFQALMAASPDGRVPPHLLERLKEIEGRRREAATPPASPPASSPRRSSPPGRTRVPAGRNGDAEEDRQLYATFAQLLLEQEEEAAD
jgi:hypothetical protein